VHRKEDSSSGIKCDREQSFDGCLTYLRKMCFQSARLTTWKRRSGGRNAGGCGVVACRLADDLVTGQRKTLVVLSVVVVTVLGALTGLMIGFTLVEQISLHTGTTLDTQQLGSFTDVIIK